MSNVLGAIGGPASGSRRGSKAQQVGQGSDGRKWRATSPLAAQGYAVVASSGRVKDRVSFTRPQRSAESAEGEGEVARTKGRVVVRLSKKHSRSETPARPGGRSRGSRRPGGEPGGRPEGRRRRSGMPMLCKGESSEI